MCMRMCVYVSVHVCACVYVCICVGVCPCKSNCIKIYIYIYIPEKWGTKASSRQTSARVAAQVTWSTACESAVPRMRGWVCNDNGDGGSREASRAASG